MTKKIKAPMKYVRIGILASLILQFEYQSNIANDEISKSPKPPCLIYPRLGGKKENMQDTMRQIRVM